MEQGFNRREPKPIKCSFDLESELVTNIAVTYTVGTNAVTISQDDCQVIVTADVVDNLIKVLSEAAPNLRTHRDMRRNIDDKSWASAKGDD